MTTTINCRTPDEITYNCMMYRLKIPNEWDEHCAGSLTLKGRVETAKWAYNYIQQLEHHIGELTEKVAWLEEECDLLIADLRKAYEELPDPPKEDA